MTPSQSTRSRSRRLLVLLVLAVSTGGALVGWTRTTSTYQSAAAVVVVPAMDAAPGGNPLAGLDDNIARLALVVSAQLDGDPVRDKVMAAGGDGSHVADTQLTSPLIRLTATAATAAGAQRATQVLAAEASTQLASVQSAANVPSDARARVVAVTPAATGVEVGPSPLQAAVVLGAGAGLTSWVLLVAGAWRSARRDRGVAEAAPTTPPVDLVVASASRAEDESRFAPPSEATSDSPHGARRRQELMREMVREDWQRSGSNVPWTRRQQREAYDRAEQRLAASQRRLHDLEIENLRAHDEPFDHRELG